MIISILIVIATTLGYCFIAKVIRDTLRQKFTPEEKRELDQKAEEVIQERLHDVNYKI